MATMYLLCSPTIAAVGESVGGSGFDKEASLLKSLPVFSDSLNVGTAIAEALRRVYGGPRLLTLATQLHIALERLVDSRNAITTKLRCSTSSAMSAMRWKLCRSCTKMLIRLSLIDNDKLERLYYAT